MDALEFLRVELNTNGNIANMVHNLTLYDLKVLLEKYAGLQSNYNGNIPTPGPKQTDKQD